MTNEQAALQKRVQTYGFAVLEANLFLDTHPHDSSALEYFKKADEMYKKARGEYAEKYGALCAGEVSSDAESWDWINGEWPWMIESEAGK